MRHLRQVSLEVLQHAAELLGGAQRIVVFTGAGVSAESGVPTYRSGADGLWSQQNMQRFANPEGYAANLPDAYEWYRARAQAAAAAQPNAGHYAIAAMEKRAPSLFLATQNIDSLHQRAGSTNVVELHGHLRTARCARCEWRVDWESAPSDPSCTHCGGMLRPDVVMFHEMLPQAEYAAAFDAASECNVLISVGTSNQVAPASEIPRVALRRGAWALIVNPDMEGQPIHWRALYFPGQAGEVLPVLHDLAWPHESGAGGSVVRD